MKNYFYTILFLVSNAHFLFAQHQPMSMTNGKLDLEINTSFTSIEESFETYFHGYPPSKENGSKLSKRGIRNIKMIHPDTITVRQSAKSSVATQEVILDYKLSPKGYLYFFEQHNRRTGHKISETTTEWKEGKVIQVNTGGRNEYITTFEYDEEGRLKTKYRDRVGNSKGRHRQLTSTYSYGKHPNERTIVFERRNKYAGKREKISKSKKKIIEKVYNLDDVITEEIHIKHNKYGHVVKMIKKNLKKDTTNKTVFKYNYDKQGNWVEQKEYFDKLLMSVRTRKIAY